MSSRSQRSSPSARGRAILRAVTTDWNRQLAQFASRGESGLQGSITFGRRSKLVGRRESSESAESPSKPPHFALSTLWAFFDTPAVAAHTKSSVGSAL